MEVLIVLALVVGGIAALMLLAYVVIAVLAIIASVKIANKVSEKQRQDNKE